MRRLSLLLVLLFAGCGPLAADQVKVRHVSPATAGTPQGNIPTMLVHMPSLGVYANPPPGAGITTLAAYFLDNAGWQTAATRAIAAGSQHLFFQSQWSGLEPSVGNYSDTLLDRFVANSGGLPLWIDIALVDTDAARHVPSELASADWASAPMRSAFKNLLTHIQSHVGHQLVQLSIGNEADFYLDAHSSEIAAYGYFVGDVGKTAHWLFGSNPFAVTVTFTATAALAHFSNYAAITANTDRECFTYYHNLGHTAAADYANLAAAANGPFVFQELGSTSDAAQSSSSEAIQLANLQSALTILPTTAGFQGFTWFQMTDYSTAVLTDAGYTTPLLEFFTKIGLRTTSNTPKSAWATLVAYLGGSTGD